MEPRMTKSLSTAGKNLVTHTSTIPEILSIENVSSATRLLEKRRQMFEVQDALDLQKEEYARQEDSFSRREDQLRRKDLEMQESLVKFNTFLEENELKRSRANKRANEEIKQRQHEEEVIETLKTTLMQSLLEKDKLAIQVKRNLKYLRFLETVQEAAPEDFPEISDLVNRYRTLSETNRDLRQLQNRNDSENDEKRAEVTIFQRERANEILSCNNRIAALQHTLEEKDAQLVRLQHTSDNNARSTTQKTLALGQITMAISNLLQRATSGTHGKLLKHADGVSTAVESSGGSRSSEIDIVARSMKAMAELDVVAAYIIDFSAIVQDRQEYQRTKKKATATTSQTFQAGLGPGIVSTKLPGASAKVGPNSAYSADSRNSIRN
uniref:Uncharacterized protein AlNc14C1G38 n=1 Tax=Albugo laibachii Nc14 TaxID=890382 RepID=F0VYN6_9STRA|nr:conserved hypothetical protein [Albugo laibachii Nc14]|eukprot:CCA13900.1 conserved hypothetical protein [Albugo laibachii Nc14]